MKSIFFAFFEISDIVVLFQTSLIKILWRIELFFFNIVMYLNIIFNLHCILW